MTGPQDGAGNNGQGRVIVLGRRERTCVGAAVSGGIE